MIESLGTADECRRRDELYDVPDAMGAEWIRAGVAIASDEPPAHIVDFNRRISAGAGEPCLFLPFLGEFGHQVMTHLRWVHFHQATHKVVCCRPGDQVLYPSAEAFVTDWLDPIPDAGRCGTCRGSDAYGSWRWPQITARFPAHRPIDCHDLTPIQEMLAIEPATRIPFQPRRRGLFADVVLGVRRRAFCPERNWPHWQALADAIAAAGYSFAVIGHKETSFALGGQVCHSGDFDSDLAIELLRFCQLYIGNDSGNSHLAATVGARTLIFREVAGGSRDMTPRMEQVNRGRVQVLPAAAWKDPGSIINAALAALGE